MPVSYPPFYDVRAAVGDGRLNLTPDLMLVQYFLAGIYFRHGDWHIDFPKIYAPLTSPTAGGPEVVYPPDGVPRKGLGEWIRGFQIGATAKGYGTLTCDGVVSHAGLAWYGKRRGPALYTIQVLNYLFFRADEKRFWNLRDDDSLPPLLQKELTFWTFAEDPFFA
jgi:hypothetical protein